MQSQRSPESEYILISTNHFDDKSANRKNQKGISKTVLIVNNWHFNRDVLEMGNPTKCKPENCSVQLKISSTAFQVKSSSDKKSSSDSFHFDKQGIILPYPAFVWLCGEKPKETLESFVDDIQKLYHKDLQPNIVEEVEQNDDLIIDTQSHSTEDQENADDDNEPLNKKCKKTRK